MHEPALAIDFGTSRTKVASRDADGNVHLLHFDGVPYLPSLFYLPSGSADILIGQDAYNALEDDPLSVVSELKRAIQGDAAIRITKDRPVDPQALIVRLFQAIKQRALADIKAFDGVSPEQIWLTVPGNASEILVETMLKRAARTVGWDMAQVLHEPVAAARHWLFGEGHTEATEAMVVVLDCGGGTTDWACLQRTGKKIHRAEHFIPNAVNVGGADVDQALSDWVRERVREQYPELDAEQREPNLRKRLRNWKEATFKGENPTPIRIKGHNPGLDEAVLNQEYTRVLLAKVLPPFAAFLMPIAKQYPDVPVLLVGGSATELLEKAINEIHPVVYRSQDSVGAVIRGALVTAAERTGQQTQEETKARPQPPTDGDLILLADNANEITVAKEGAAHCRTISDALNKIAENGVIKIKAGHYQESLEINKSVSLIGDDAKQVCIQSINSRVIAITNATVMLRELTVRGINVGSNLPEDSDQALRYCISVEQSVISAEQCQIISDDGNGLFFRGASVSSRLQSSKIRAYSGCFLVGSVNLTLEKCELENEGTVMDITEKCVVSLVESKLSSGYMWIKNDAKCNIRNSQVNFRKYASLQCSGESSILIEKSTISAEQAKAICIDEKSSVIAFNTKFTGETAVRVSDNAKFKANECQFVANGDGDGDWVPTGISFSDFASVSLENCLIDSAKYGISGGNEANIQMLGCKILTGDIGISVGDSSKGVINNSEFVYTNKATKHSISAGIYANDNSKFQFESCVFQGFGKGASLNENCNVQINKCKFISNGAVSDIGQPTGIDIWGSSKKIEVENSEIKGYEVGIYISEEAEPRISKCKLSGADVGVATSGKSKAIITKCELKEFACGFILGDESEPRVRNCVLSGNGTSTNTGVVISDLAKAYVTDCEISGYEWGIRAKDDAAPRISDCKLIGTGREGYGGIRISDSCKKAAIHGCNIRRYDWGMYVEDQSYPSVYKCTMTENTIGVGIFNSASLTIDDCDLTGNTNDASRSETTGNIKSSNNSVKKVWF